MKSVIISISVIICSRNRADSLEKTLDSLVKVRIPSNCKVEVIVVDNGSTDRTRSIVDNVGRHSSTPLRYLYESRCGKSRALNAAVRNTSGEVLLLSDDDVRFPENWFEGMCQPIYKGQIDLVQGGIRWANKLQHYRDKCPYLSRVIASTEHRKQNDHLIEIIGANLAVSREALLSVDGFDEELGPGALGFGEETLLGWRLEDKGWRVGAAYDVEVEHVFDVERLGYSDLLNLAEKRGRSLGYLQHHWHHRREKHITEKCLWIRCKDICRTMLGGGTLSRGDRLPEWKFSYRATLGRLRQIASEQRQPAKYTKTRTGRSKKGSPVMERYRCLGSEMKSQL